MFCPNCGAQNQESVANCHKCGFNLKSAAAPKFKGTMLMMNQQAFEPPLAGAPPGAPTGSAPPAAPPRPAPPAPPAPKIKGTMVGMAPPPEAFGQPPAQAAGQEQGQPHAFAPPGQQGSPVNPLGGTMAFDAAGFPPAQGPGAGESSPPAYGAPAVEPPPAYGGHPQGGYGAPAAPPAYGSPQGAFGQAGSEVAGAMGAAADAGAHAYGQAQAAFGYGAPAGAPQMGGGMGMSGGGAAQGGGYGAPPGGYGSGGYGAPQGAYGAPPGGYGGPAPTDLNTTLPLILAAATFFCGWGLLALLPGYFAWMAKQASEQGQYAEAFSKAKTSKTISFVMLGVSLAGILAYVVFIVIAIVGASAGR